MSIKSFDMITSLKKAFFNVWYKIRPPEMVKYWKWGDAARAKITKGEDGNDTLYIEGEKYAFPGVPRGHVLLGPLASIKKAIKQKVFNEVFAELQRMADDAKYDMTPAEKMAPAVKELHRVFDLMESAEVTDDMKGRIRLIKRVFTFFFQEDDAYRFRMQWMFDHLDIDKMKLSKADKYYFRGKYFKVDHAKFDY